MPRTRRQEQEIIQPLPDSYRVKEQPTRSKRVKGISQDTYQLLFTVTENTGLRLGIPKIDVKGRATLVAYSPVYHKRTGKKMPKIKRTVLAERLEEAELVKILNVLDKFAACEHEKPYVSSEGDAPRVA